MKKVLFAAIAVCGFAFANAQSSDNSSADINLNIVKTIQIVPQNAGNDAFGVTFDKPAQFGTWQSMGANKMWGFSSTDGVDYTVSFDRGSIPVGVQLRYDLQDYGHVGLIANKKDIAQPTSSSLAPGGAADDVSAFVSLEANVPWGIPAGAYTGTMTITATSK